MNYSNPWHRDDYRPPRDAMRRLWFDGVLCGLGLAAMILLAWIIISGIIRFFPPR